MISQIARGFGAAGTSANEFGLEEMRVSADVSQVTRGLLCFLAETYLLDVMRQLASSKRMIFTEMHTDLFVYSLEFFCHLF